MARNNERNDQHGLSPGTSFPQQGESQYPQPEHPYSYPSNNEFPPLSDHDLGIATQAYSQPIQQNIATQLQEAAQNGSGRDSNGSMRVNTNGSAIPATAALHQNANAQSLSAAGRRDSVDHTPDSATPGDKSRTKAKASQACDECRRKKTKCITTVSEDGVPTPCNSCVKAGLDCQYSRQPLKRGPNKGYIKDLADRVQQVESLMHQPGYRQSFDGDMFAAGDEPMSGRRNFSLPGGRTSFSGPDFGRDRFGSLTSAFAPMSAAPGTRERFSIAVPPDQRLNSVNFYDDSDQRPAKRLKMDAENTPALPFISINADDFANYYSDIHSQFPLLPDSSEVAVSIVQKASTLLQHALIATLNLLPAATISGDNTAKSRTSIKTIKDMSERMTTAYEEQLMSAPTAPDAIVYVWTATLLVIHAEFAIDTYNYGSLASQFLVRNVAEIIGRLKSTKSTSLLTEEKAQGLEVTMLQDVVGRAHCMTSLQNKLVLLATGLANVVDSATYPSYDEVDSVLNLPPAARFLAHATKTIAHTITLLQNQHLDKFLQSSFKISFLDGLELIAAPRAQLDTSSSLLYQQLEEFLKLLTARTSFNPTSLDCLMPAAKLAEKLGHSSATYSPLDIHLYTTCVFTFLEVLALPNTPNNEFAGPVAITGLSSIRPVLQQKANMYTTTARSPNDKVFWGTVDGKALVKVSWAEALLQHIDAAEQRGWVNENTLKYQNMLAGRTGMPDVTGNFCQLVDQGYLTVLSWYAAERCAMEMMEVDNAGDGGVDGNGNGNGSNSTAASGEDNIPGTSGTAMASAAETAAAATAVAAESLAAGS